MNLSNPLESLMKPAQANVLLAFVRVGERLTGRQVARVLGSTSPSGTRETLLQLTKVGLLTADATPHAIYYSLNRQHLLWPAIEHTANVWDLLRTTVEQTTRTAAPEGTAVLLYGSTARARSTADSDVDLLVVFPGTVPAHDRDAFSSTLASVLHRATGNRIEVFDLTQDQLVEMVGSGDPMIASWRTDVLLLAGPGSAVELLRSA